MYFPGIKLSNNEETPEDMHHNLPAQDAQAPENDNEEPDTLQEHQELPPAAMHLLPFDFHQSICLFGCDTATIFKALDQLDAHIPPGVLDQWLCATKALEEVSGKSKCILHILHI